MTNSKRVFRVSRPASRLIYSGLIGLGIMMMVFTDGHLGEAFLGVALFFDPFDPEVPLNKRPWWQQFLLIIHALVIIGFILWDLIH